MVIKIIQPNFAPGDDFGLLGQARQFLQVDTRSQLRLMGMDPDGSENRLMLGCKLNPAIQRPRPGSTANSDNGCHTSVPRPPQHDFAICIKLLHLEMRMGLDKNQSSVVGHWSLVIGCWPLASCSHGSLATATAGL